MELCIRSESTKRVPAFFCYFKTKLKSQPVIHICKSSNILHFILHYLFKLLTDRSIFRKSAVVWYIQWILNDARESPCRHRIQNNFNGRQCKFKYYYDNVIKYSFSNKLNALHALIYSIDLGMSSVWIIFVHICAMIERKIWIQTQDICLRTNYELNLQVKLHWMETRKISILTRSRVLRSCLLAE